MGFRFQLATLMRLREISEQREERLLGQILNQITQSRETLDNLEEQRRNLCTQRELTMQQSTSAFEIQGFHQQMLKISELEIAGKEHLAKLGVLREQQMKVYETAHRNRELLSEIRNDRREAYVKEQTRQEQNAMDDNFSSRKKSY